MKGRELNVEEPKEKSQEEIARKVIEDLYSLVKDRKELLKEAEDKLTEVLEKDVEDIKEKDAEHWNW